MVLECWRILRQKSKLWKILELKGAKMDFLSQKIVRWGFSELKEAKHIEF
jgi:hypothetical protein